MLPGDEGNREKRGGRGEEGEREGWRERGPGGREETS